MTRLTPARILVVDDHQSARIAIRALLRWHQFDDCGEASDGKEAIDRVRELQPDAVLLDINMPRMHGIQEACEIRKLAPSTKILFVTVHDAPEFANAARIFAQGFVSKSAIGIELIPTLNSLLGLDVVVLKAGRAASPQG
jgi:DNA-binding NarL/FixJ family response regulator